MTKISKIYKHTELNTANFGNFNHTDYQVFLHLISKISKADKDGKYIQPELLHRIHSLSAKEFSEMFNTDLSNCYSILKRAVDKLMKTDIRIQGSDKKFWRINICSSAEYNESAGTVIINFTDHIMPYLAQVQRKFVLYNLKEITSFRSLYTTRLYELIQNFKETGWITKSINQLREIFAVDHGKLATYHDFKKKTFGHACEEINANYDMNLTFAEIKEGRKVVAIKFFFNKTKIRQVANRITGKISNIYDKPKTKIIKKVTKAPVFRSKTTKHSIKTVDNNHNDGTIDDIEKSSIYTAKPIGSVISSLLSKWLPNSK